MKTNHESALTATKHWRFRAPSALGVVLLSFVAGSLLTARWMYASQVRADSNRVFELMIYHTVPGKVPALESIFRDVSKLEAKHNLNVVGYWVPTDDPSWKDTFIYVVAHPSLEEAKKNWHAFHADPEFPPSQKAAEPLIEKSGEAFRVDEVYMRPSDFSPMK